MGKRAMSNVLKKTSRKGREDAENAKGRGKGLLISRLSLNKMKLERKTIILHTKTLRPSRLRAFARGIASKASIAINYQICKDTTNRPYGRLIQRTTKKRNKQ